MIPKIKYILSCTVLFILVSPTGFPQFNKAFFFYRSEELISQGKYNEAIPVLNTLINVDSTIHEAWFLRGVARYYQNDFAGAQNDFDKCLNINPLFSQSYQYSAMVFEQNGQRDEAIGAIRKAIELRPNSAQYNFTYGVILFQQQKYNEALKVFNHVIHIDNRIPDAWLNRGAIRLMLSDSVGALDDFTKAINLTPFSPAPYMRRGALHAQMRNYSQALSDLNQAISNDSTYAKAYFTRALVYYYMKQPELSLQDLNRTLLIEPRNTLALFNRAIISYETENPEAAIDDLTRLSSIIPTNVLVHYYLASIRFEKGYLPMALENVNKAIELFPQFANAYQLRAEIKAKSGDLKAAEADFTLSRKLAAEYQANSNNQFSTLMDSTGKIKHLLSFDEELDLISTLNMELLKEHLITIVYPLIALKIGKSKNVKNSNWQSSALRQLLTKWQCDDYTIYFDYDNAIAASVSEFEDININELCKVLVALQNNQYNRAMNIVNDLCKANSNNSIYSFVRIITQIKTAQFIEEIRNKSQYTANQGYDKENESYRAAIDEIKQQILVEDLEGILPYNAGVVCMKLDQSDDAIEWFSKTIETNPLIHGAWYNRGLLRLLKNEVGKGCSDLRRAVDLGNEQAPEVVSRFCKQ